MVTFCFSFLPGKIQRGNLAWIGLFAFIAFASSLPNHACAEVLPTYSVARLMMESTAVIVVKPIEITDGKIDGSYKVTNILSGEGVEVGEEIKITADYYTLAADNFFDLRGEKLDTNIEKAIVFLSARKTNDQQVSMAFSGIRMLNTSEQVLKPIQLVNPGPFMMRPAFNISIIAAMDSEEARAPVTWTDLVETIRSADKNLSLFEESISVGTDKEKSAAAMHWITEQIDIKFPKNKHGQELDNSRSVLINRAARVVTTHGSPSMRFELLNHTLIEPVLYDGTFLPHLCSTEGRRLLLDGILDPANQDDRRRIDLYLMTLAASFTVSDLGPADNHPLESADEFQMLFSRFVQAMKDPGRHVEFARLAGIAIDAHLPYANDVSRVLSELEALYENEALHEIEAGSNLRVWTCRLLSETQSEKYWEELSGNPGQIVVSLRQLADAENKMRLSCNIWKDRATIDQRTRLIVTRMTDSGMPLESSNIDFQVQENRGSLNLLISRTALPKGRYRIELEGEYKDAIKEKTWTSIPIFFR